MCGIAGGDDANHLIAALEHRGKSTSTARVDGFALAHRLHPVVGHCEQPITHDGTLVANCEIYNWQELAERYDIDAENDADLLCQLLDRKDTTALQECDGVYAFAYYNDGELVLGRDPLGVKPVFYTTSPFRFASEQQALEQLGERPQELHPRHTLRYDLETGNVSTEHRGFYEIDEHDMSLEEATIGIAERFEAAVKKRIPDTEVGVLFSGGVDSTLVAATLERLDVDATYYTAGIQHGNVDAPRDVRWARKVADEMGLDLEVHMADLAEVETLLPDITDWVSSTSVVKTGVALPFYLALQGNEPVVFSGLGSEQLYAGYNRHQGYLNKECLSGLRRLSHRDLYRDDVIAMRRGYELRVPFLDDALIRHALQIPPDYKVNDGYRKYVLRKAAEQLGVPEDVCWRKKRAAQYGSNFDKAIDRLAKNAGADSKQAYLNRFRATPNHRLGALFSGGKDSCAAAYRMQRRNCEIACLINLQSARPDSYMFDSKQKDRVVSQAERMDVPLVVQQTAGEKEAELADLETAMHRARENYGIEGVVAGTLASTYQRDRVEAVADRAGLRVFAPLWQEDPAQYMRWLVREGFEIEITETAARGLDDSWEGTVLDADRVEELIALAEQYRFNAAGEGGEYETLVQDGPLFIRGKPN